MTEKKMSMRERLQQKREETKQKRASFTRAYKFKPGKTKLRILPSWRGDEEVFFHDFGEHWLKDIETGKAICPIGDRSICFGEVDPIREKLEEAFRLEEDPDRRKILKDMKAKTATLVNALILNDKDVDPRHTHRSFNSP